MIRGRLTLLVVYTVVSPWERNAKSMSIPRSNAHFRTIASCVNMLRMITSGLFSNRSGTGVAAGWATVPSSATTSSAAVSAASPPVSPSVGKAASAASSSADFSNSRGSRQVPTHKTSACWMVTCVTRLGIGEPGSKSWPSMDTSLGTNSTTWLISVINSRRPCVVSGNKNAPPSNNAVSMTRWVTFGSAVLNSGSISTIRRVIITSTRSPDRKEYAIPENFSIGKDTATLPRSI